MGKGTKLRGTLYTVRSAIKGFSTPKNSAAYTKAAREYAHQKSRANKMAPAVSGFTSSGVGKKIDLSHAIKHARTESNMDTQVDKHELLCGSDDCAGRIQHLLDDAYRLREAAGELLSLSGFQDRLEHKDLAALRRAVKEYDQSPAT